MGVPVNRPNEGKKKTRFSGAAQSVTNLVSKFQPKIEKIGLGKAHFLWQ